MGDEAKRSGEFAGSEDEAREAVNVLLFESRMCEIPQVVETVEDFESGQTTAIETLAVLMAFIDNRPAPVTGRTEGSDG